MIELISKLFTLGFGLCLVAILFTIEYFMFHVEEGPIEFYPPKILYISKTGDLIESTYNLQTEIWGNKDTKEYISVSPKKI